MAEKRVSTDHPSSLTQEDIFGPAHTSEAGEESPHPLITFEDMDNDGDRDMVVTPASGQAEYWLANELGNDAEQIFGRAPFASITPTAMALGDLDDDGRPDMVVGHDSGIKIFYSDAHGPAAKLNLHNVPRTIFLEDVDRDGQTDIVVRDSNGLTLFTHAAGGFGSVMMSWANLGDSSLMAIGDMDLTNTTLEILTLNANTGLLSMITHDAMAWQAIQTVCDVEVSSFIVADMNFDGMDDIFIGDEDGNIVWLENDGLGNLTIHASYDPLAFNSQEFLDNIFETYSASYVETIISAGTAAEDYATEEELTYSLEQDTDLALDVVSQIGDSVFDSETFISFLNTLMSHPTTPPSEDSTPPLDGEDPANSDLPPPPLTADDESQIENTIKTLNPLLDLIQCNELDNFIKAHGGDDIIFGGQGEDTILGGNGMDIIIGEQDNDFLAGQRGTDFLFGGKGNDIIMGGMGNDVLYGNDGEDILFGGDGDDILFGGNGNGILCGGRGKDEMIGDRGREVFHYTSTEEGGDIIHNFDGKNDSLSFEFGTRVLLNVMGPYTGDLDMDGSAFIWEHTDDHSGRLYYDADTNMAGDEILIAEIDLSGDHTDFSVDDITIL